MYVAHSAIRPHLKIRAEAQVPTRFGEFRMIVFNHEVPTTGQKAVEAGLSPDHVALVMGDVSEKTGVLVRVHSECLTSEVFGSLKCDCKEQLEIAKRGAGVVLYMRQEGRGIGLVNKIRAYDLQSHGHDTVDANRLLDLPDDLREYDGAAAMLDHLGVRSIRLLTNNPDKVEKLRRCGIQVEGRAPSLIVPNQHSAGYLETKRDRMNHALPHYDADHKTA